MLFEEVDIAGAFVLTPERRADERGYFARIHCEQALAEHRLVGGICQINTGFNPRAGTLRGMHLPAGAARRGQDHALPARCSFRCHRRSAARFADL